MNVLPSKEFVEYEELANWSANGVRQDFNQMQIHIRMQHDSSIKTFKCKLCSKLFIKESLFQSHNCRDRQPCKCDVCGRQLKNGLNLEKHEVLLHSQPGVIFCNVCAKLFSTADERDKHHVQYKLKKKMGTLKLSGRFECDMCRIISKTKNDLRRHMLVRHNPDGDKFKCKICKRLYSSELTLQQHRCKGKSKNSSLASQINPCYS